MRTTWIAALVALAIAGCGRRTTQSGLILERGTYPSPHAVYDLVVSLNEGLVTWRVVDRKTTETKAACPYRFSTYQRWFFFWDNQDRLWTYNSDIGPFSVWSKTPDQRFVETQVEARSESIKQVPKDVRIYLPHSMIKQLQLQPLPGQGELPQ